MCSNLHLPLIVQKQRSLDASNESIFRASCLYNFYTKSKHLADFSIQTSSRSVVTGRTLSMILLFYVIYSITTAKFFNFVQVCPSFSKLCLQNLWSRHDTRHPLVHFSVLDNSMLLISFLKSWHLTFTDFHLFETFLPMVAIVDVHDYWVETLFYSSRAYDKINFPTAQYGIISLRLFRSNFENHHHSCRMKWLYSWSFALL